LLQKLAALQIIFILLDLLVGVGRLSSPNSILDAFRVTAALFPLLRERGTGLLSLRQKKPLARSAERGTGAAQSAGVTGADLFPIGHNHPPIPAQPTSKRPTKCPTFRPTGKACKFEAFELLAIFRRRLLHWSASPIPIRYTDHRPPNKVALVRVASFSGRHAARERALSVRIDPRMAVLPTVSRGMTQDSNLQHLQTF
jgi:hypothetical protein